MVNAVNAVIDLSGQQPRWPAAARGLWARCAAEAAGDEQAWREPARGGDPRLRSWLGARYGFDPQHLTIVAGVRAVALALADVHQRAVLHAPTFLGLRPQLEAVASVELAYDLARDLAPGDLLLLDSPARNPDGRTWGAADREAVAAQLARGVRVMVNETYREWEPTAERVAAAETMASFHKLAGVGARLAYVHSRTFLSGSVRQLAAAEPPLVWQRAWALFLERSGMDLLVAENVASSQASARAYDVALAELVGPLSPAAGPHRLHRLPDDVAEQDALRLLADRGYQVAGGSFFGMDRPSLRLCFLGVDASDAATLPRLLARLGLVRPLGSEEVR